jgi:hypothetical protein
LPGSGYFAPELLPLASKRRRMKMAVKFTFSYLLIVAATGVWMRTMPFLPDLGLPFEHLRHAHSHLAFLGWVYSAFLLAFSAAFLPTGTFEKPRFQQIFWLTQLSACCMFAAFLGQGYGPVSIGFLTLHTLLAYLFFGYFLKNARLPGGKASTLFALGAIFSFIFSSFGPFAIPFITVLGDGNPVHLKMAVHFYLHFHYNGWFVFGLLALLFKTLENESVAFPFRLAKWQFRLMLTGLFPAYFLMVPFFEMPEFGTSIVKAGVVAQWIGMCIFAAVILSNRAMMLRVLRTPLKFLLGFSLTVLFLKFTVEMLTVFPVVFNLAKSANHFLTVGWLHLLFLGSITPFLWWFFAKKGWGKWTGAITKTGTGVFLTGFVFTELLLFATGLGYVIPSLPQWLLAFASLILGGIILLSPGIFQPRKTMSKRGEIAPVDKFEQYETTETKY